MQFACQPGDLAGVQVGGRGLPERVVVAVSLAVAQVAGERVDDGGHAASLPLRLAGGKTTKTTWAWSGSGGAAARIAARSWSIAARSPVSARSTTGADWCRRHRDSHHPNCCALALRRARTS